MQHGDPNAPTSRLVRPRLPLRLRRLIALCPFAIGCTEFISAEGSTDSGSVPAPSDASSTSAGGSTATSGSLVTTADSNSTSDGDAGESSTAGTSGESGVCGDGALDTLEECDHGTKNGTPGDTCTVDCRTDPCRNGAGGARCDDSPPDDEGPPDDARPVCGDDVVDPGEDCDGERLGETTCEDFGFAVGAVGCSPRCTFDTSECGTCGNGEVDRGESCDGDDLDGASCRSLGLGGGVLTCDRSCEYDVSGCGTCGNGELDDGEACDGDALGRHTCESEGFDGGELSCTDDCELDTSACTSECDDDDRGERCDER